MPKPIAAQMKVYERVRDLDRIAIPMIPTVGVEMAYRIALAKKTRRAPQKADTQSLFGEE